MTDTMFLCIDFMHSNGGVLHRQPGGFWTDSANYSPYQRTFGTSTVQGLVRRGVAEYVEWQEGRSGKFPIKAQVRSRGKP